MPDPPDAPPKRPQVLFVNHAAVLGGAELTLLDLAQAYQSSSHLLLFSAGPFQDRLQAIGITPQVIPAAQELLGIRTFSGLKTTLSAVPSLLQMARHIADAAQGFDLIHANSQKAFIAVAVAALLFKCPPVVWYLHDLLSAPRFSGINRSMAIWLANRCANRVLVNSQATERDFVALGGRQDRVRLLYPGISAQQFDRITPATRHSIRTQLGIGDAPLVGLFSRISFIKGHHILLEAVRHLPNVHVLFVGDALFGENEYLSKIQAIANQPDLAHRVHWLGFREDIPELMAACDVLVDASTEFNSFGRVIVEGQLSGVPMIATLGGAAPELIEDGVTGCLVPAGDSGKLAHTIEHLLGNPDVAQSIGYKGKYTASTRFSPESQIQTYDHILQELLSS